MSDTSTVGIVTFGVFMTEALIHYNTGVADVTGQPFKFRIPPANQLLKPSTNRWRCYNCKHFIDSISWKVMLSPSNEEAYALLFRTDAFYRFRQLPLHLGIR